MIVFPEKVERWRYLVEKSLLFIFNENPDLKSSIDRFKPTLNDQTDIILAIIQKESGGNPLAYGDSENPDTHTDDSIGLMQLNYQAGTPQGVGYVGTPEGLVDPAKNIYFGTKYFLKQVKRYGSIDKAILAYNAGSYITRAGLPINLEYLNTVLSYLAEKKTLLSSELPPPDFTYISDSEKKVDTKDLYLNSGRSDTDHKTTVTAAKIQFDKDRNEFDTYDKPTYIVHRKVYDYLIGSFIAVVLTIYFFTCN